MHKLVPAHLQHRGQTARHRRHASLDLLWTCFCSSWGTFRRNIILPKPSPPADWRWWSGEYRWKGRDTGLSGSTVKNLSWPDPDAKSSSNVSSFPQDLSQENATWCRQVVVAEAMDEHFQLPGHDCCKYCENIGCMEPSWKDYCLEHTVKLSCLEMIRRKIIYLSICWRPSCSSLSLSTLFILCTDDEDGKNKKHIAVYLSYPW